MRKMYRFWLDHSKFEEKLIAEDVQALKDSRSFSRVVRDGIRLIVDLQQGSTDVLFSLFPDLKRTLTANARGVDNERIARLEGQIALLLNSGASLRQLEPTPKPVIEPDFVVQKDTSDNAAKNLLGAMSGLM